MSVQIPLLLTLTPLISLCQGIVVTQEKKQLTVNPGDSVALPCHHDDKSGTYDTMLWYQQKSGGALMVLAVSIGKNDSTIEEQFRDTWTMERPDIENSVLSRGNVAPQDSAMYYCAVRKHRHGG
ncbi:hypothetical protein XELAEV_18034186mg [Xenopus laevis]|uniref:Ig-like domain-containing protein n=1 Tax=Xenopus laevis TaxID=8355 RepID=A0A974HAU9_XENLA|nr:hypothetical protein XELAEV_18034186mg [Xenopus laevis]